MMEQNINKKEGNGKEDFLSSIEALQDNLTDVKSSLEKELYKKDQKYQNDIINTKRIIEKIISEYNKNLSIKDKEIKNVKSSVKEIIEKYEELIRKKDENIDSIKAKQDSEHIDTSKLDAIGIPLNIIKMPKNDILSKFADLAKENIILTKKLDFINLKSKESLYNIKNEYNKFILDKDKEIAELRNSIKEIIRRYEEDINVKARRNKLLNEDSEKINQLILDNSGIPKEIISLSKEEILVKMTEIIKENIVLTKKLRFINEKSLAKQEEYITSNKAIEKSFDLLSDKFLRLQERNNSMEQALSVFRDKILILSRERAAEKEFYEKKIAQLISYYELKINELTDRNTKEKMHMELSINMLKNEIDDYKKIIADKESKKEEFLRDVEERIKSVIRPKASDFLNDYESNQAKIIDIVKPDKSEDLIIQIQKALSNGNNKERIVFDLMNKGFDKAEILNAYKNVKK